MTLYHGSLERVTAPEIRVPNRTLDYGAGFYATTSSKQAEEWVRRRMRGALSDKGYVNEYALNTELLNQYLFHSPRALETITFIKAKEILL